MSFFTDDVKPRLQDGASTVVIAQQVGCTVADVARIARSNGYRVQPSGRLIPAAAPPDYGRAETPLPRKKGPAMTATDPRVGMRELTTHTDKRIAKAAGKALAAYDTLTDLVSDYQDKAQARLDVERLERELVAARAKLRPAKKPQETRDWRAIRTWAKEQSIDCPATGRVPRTVVEQYDAYQAA